MITFFWIAVSVIIFTYLGYGLVMFLLSRFRIRKSLPVSHTPSCTLVIAAYNEADIIEEKIKNCLELNYPAQHLRILFVTDGSTDGTPGIVSRYAAVDLLHQDQRSGKINAINRAMQQVHSDIVVFTDANTFLNRDALLKIAAHYQDQKVGAVAGEKQVIAPEGEATEGEGFYWKYESKLKEWDARVCSVVGAAGELFSIRRELYEHVPADTILDDFIISLRIAAKGYRVAYEPGARAREFASANLREELKRKIRIAAGGIQAIVRLLPLLNIFKYGLLSFQYIGHRVLRWTVTPILLPVLLVLNIVMVIMGYPAFYFLALVAQVFFYGAALIGYKLSGTGHVPKVLMIPAYFCVMNYAVLAGMVRYLRGRQSAAWERVQRGSPAAGETSAS